MAEEKISMAQIKVGDRFPDVTLTLVKNEDKAKVENVDGCANPQLDFITVQSSQYLAGKKVVLVSVPEKHLPGFISNYDALKLKGIDEIICLSVNDKFVMKAWAQHLKAESKVVMLADGSGQITQALGLSLDLISRGLGMRSQRFAAVIVDGVVNVLNVEKSGEFNVSTAEAILSAL